MSNQGQKENGPPDLLVIWHREPDENFEKLALKITYQQFPQKQIGLRCFSDDTRWKNN